MLCCCCSQFSIFFSPIKVIFHLGSQNWQEEEELPSGFISSPLKCFLLRISVGIEEASVHGRRKTFQSEAVNLRSGPQVCPRLSDMLNRSTLTLSAASAFPTHPFWCVVPSIYHLSPGGGGGVENSLCGLLSLKSTTREPYIWVPPLHDVKTGADPKPAAQRVPQRGRGALFSLPVPPWHLPAGGNLGEPFEEARAQSMENLAQQIVISLTGQVGRRELRPPACTFNCLKFSFHSVSLFHRGALHLSSDWFRLSSAVCVSEPQSACSTFSDWSRQREAHGDSAASA